MSEANKEKNVEGCENTVSAKILSPAVLVEIGSAVQKIIDNCQCSCTLTAGFDMQAEQMSCGIFGCKEHGEVYIDTDLRKKHIDALKINEDWQLAASLGELMLIAPEINSLLMKALEERGIKPTPYHIHTLVTLIQQLSGAAL